MKEFIMTVIMSVFCASPCPAPPPMPPDWIIRKPEPIVDDRQRVYLVSRVVEYSKKTGRPSGHYWETRFIY